MQALNLFGAEHCVGDRAKQDFTGKVLVLSPEALREQYWSQENQLWYARSGFGYEPHSSGRAVFATCLSDAKQPDGTGRISSVYWTKNTYGLGAGKAGGVENAGTDGRPHNGRYENEVRRILA